MTTSEDLRLALRQAVAEPPPMSAELTTVLAEGHHPIRRRRRTGFIAGVVVAGAAAAAVAAWSLRTPGSERAGLERYNPAAIEAARRDGGDVTPLPDSNNQVIVVMEIRYVCQNLYRYLDDPSPAAAAELRQHLRDSDRVVGPQIEAFTGMARGRLAEAESDGSAAPVLDMSETECPPRDRLQDPILRGGP